VAVEGNTPCLRGGKSARRGCALVDPIYVAAPIEFPVAIIHLYTGPLRCAKGKKADAVSSAINIRAKSYAGTG